MKVKARLSTQKPEEAVEVEYNFGGNLAEATQLFGEEVVYNNAVDSLVILLQSMVRRMIKAGKSAAEIQDAVSKWKPDTRNVIRLSAAERVNKDIEKLSAEERQQLLEKLMAAA